MTGGFRKLSAAALALIPLAIAEARPAYANPADKKPAAAKKTEQVVEKPAAPAIVPVATPKTVRIDDTSPQSRPERPIAPQTPPPARAVRHGAAMASGPIAIVAIPQSPKVEPKPEAAKPAPAPAASSKSAAPAAKTAAKSAPAKPEQKTVAPAKPKR